MIDVKEFQKLKEAVEEAKSKKSQAEGVLEEKLRQLRQEFGVEDIPSAEKLLSEMEEVQSKLEQEYEDKMSEFRKKWGDRLEL